MTACEAEPTDIETLMADALSGAAVSAFQRGVCFAAHLDARLPVRVRGDAAGVVDYLRRGFARTIAADGVIRVALALWHDDGSDGPGGTDGIAGTGSARPLLEVCWSLGEDAHPAARLADLWPLPPDGVRAEPGTPRGDDRADSVLVTLPLEAAADSPPLVERARPVFDGRYMLVVGDILIDFNRYRRSLSALGLEVEMSRSFEAGLEIARRRADADEPVDLLMIGGSDHAEAERLAHAFRADPRLAGTLIARACVGREALPEGSERLFDAMRPVTRPWRRLTDILGELLEARAARAGSGPARHRGTPPIPDLAGRRLLLAEDVETNQILVRALLEPTGAQIEAVADGDAALERQTAEPADLVLMDLQMPGIGGFAAAERIRALPAPAGQVPIVALTAYARSADREQARAAGMDAYLAKPVAISEFYDLLGRLLPPAPAEE